MENKSDIEKTSSSSNLTPSGDKGDIEKNKGITVLSYIGVLFLVPLLASKDSKFAKFHAKQGLVLVIGWLFVWIPVVGWILGVIILSLSVWGIINVLSGSYQKLPIVGSLAGKFSI